MSRLSIIADSKNTVFDLSTTDLSDPAALMSAYCHAIPIGVTRTFLWELLKSGLRDRHCGELLQNREQLLAFYELLQKALAGMQSSQHLASFISYVEATSLYPIQIAVSGYLFK
jgi:hypothetical protein